MMTRKPFQPGDLVRRPFMLPSEGRGGVYLVVGPGLQKDTYTILGQSEFQVAAPARVLRRVSRED